MDIKNLDLVQISRKLQAYFQKYFDDKGIKIIDEILFSESHLLHFEEIKHLIPLEYHKNFKDDKFNGTSGLIEFDICSKNMKHEYLVMMISDEAYSKVYFLYLQEINNITDETRDILLKDFLKA